MKYWILIINKINQLLYIIWRQAEKGIRTYADSVAPYQSEQARSLIWKLYSDIIVHRIADSSPLRSENAYAQTDPELRCL